MQKPSAAMLRFTLTAFAALYLPTQAECSTWSRHALTLDLRCAIRNPTIASPDRRKFLQVICQSLPAEEPGFVLQLTTKHGHVSQVALPEGAQELSWPPDSTAFFINGGTTAISGFFVEVYTVNSSGIVERHPAFIQAAQRDMVASFPPCRALNADQLTCKSRATNPQYNMSAVRWQGGSSALDVFAEIPCSGSYGGIMCQVTGYE